MIGHAVDISWEAADSAESYKLERRVDSGGWTQVYAGDDLTYTDTAQSGWTSVQYRISAVISGVYGGLTVSNVVSIIPVSSLVISGTDGNLGTAKAPVTYSVTSDTDSPITVTEIINGHERTLTPASGQTITIPVSMLDPGAGAITIKASVQAASGAVNQTRNWTYTKTPLALPVDPYRVGGCRGRTVIFSRRPWPKRYLCRMGKAWRHIWISSKRERQWSPESMWGREIITVEPDGGAVTRHH